MSNHAMRLLDCYGECYDCSDKWSTVGRTWFHRSTAAHGTVYRVYYWTVGVLLTTRAHVVSGVVGKQRNWIIRCRRPPRQRRRDRQTDRETDGDVVCRCRRYRRKQTVPSRQLSACLIVPWLRRKQYHVGRYFAIDFARRKRCPTDREQSHAADGRLMRRSSSHATPWSRMAEPWHTAQWRFSCTIELARPSAAFANATRAVKQPKVDGAIV